MTMDRQLMAKFICTFILVKPAKSNIFPYNINVLGHRLFKRVLLLLNWFSVVLKNRCYRLLLAISFWIKGKQFSLCFPFCLLFSHILVCSAAPMTSKLNSYWQVSAEKVRIVSVHINMPPDKSSSFLHPGSSCLEKRHTCSKKCLLAAKNLISAQTSLVHSFLEMPKGIDFF